MDLIFTMLVPLIIAVVALYGMLRRVDVYDALVQGAGDGLGVLIRIVPPLIGLLTAVYMLRASGALELAGEALSPVLARLGIPVETIALLLVRPVSGSAALGGGRAHPDLWAGLPHRPDGGGDAGFHRDHLLHHSRLFRGSGHCQDPLRSPGRPLRRPGGVYGGRLGGAGAV